MSTNSLAAVAAALIALTITTVPTALAHGEAPPVTDEGVPVLPAPVGTPGAPATSGGVTLGAWRTGHDALAFDWHAPGPGWLVLGVERLGDAGAPLSAGRVPVNAFESVAVHVDAGATVTTRTGRFTQFDAARLHDSGVPAMHLGLMTPDRVAGIFQADADARFLVHASTRVEPSGALVVTVTLPEDVTRLRPGAPTHVIAFTGSGNAIPDSPFLHDVADAKGGFRVYPARASESASDATAAARALERNADPAPGVAAAALAAGAVTAGALVARAVSGRAGARAVSRARGEVRAPRARSRAERRALRRALALAGVLLAPVVAAGVPVAKDPVHEARARVPTAGPPADPCADDARERRYNVSAIHVDIIYNRFGDRDPHGMMYVLDERIDDVRAEEARLHAALRAGTLDDAYPTGAEPSFITPLVLRAAEGECLVIRFTNRLDPDVILRDLEEQRERDRDADVKARDGKTAKDVEDPVRDVLLRASMHVHGLPVDPRADGSGAVGFNPDSTVPPGASRTYRYAAFSEGAFFVHDHGDPTAFGDAQFPMLPDHYIGSGTRGLFGVVIVEPPGASWTDPFTGEEGTTDWRADVHVPGSPSFREFILFYHDPQLIAANGGPVPQPSVNHAFNYRVETLSHRLLDDLDRCPPGAAAENRGVNPCADPSLVYSSNVHGDPSTPIPRAYLGDPVRFHVVGAGMEETHVHHIHGHRWRAVDGSELATRIDSQMLGPQETWTQTFEAGAGGQGEALSPGDYMYHCHLIPHLYGGMWGFFRVHDKQESDLQPLPTRDAPPAPTPADPGFPAFMQRAMTPGTRPPLAPQEPGFDARTGLPAPAAGAPYADPCPETAPERRYRLAMIRTDAPVNDDGDFVDGLVMYAFAEDADAYERGERRPDPAVLRLRSMECIVITLENRLPEPEVDVHPALIEGKGSIHTHLLQYAVLGSDGTTTGWNYEQTIWPGEEITYRLYADVEARTVVWHAHVGPRDAFRGAFGVTLVEPEDADWRNPETGGPIYTTGRFEGDGALDSVRDPATGEFADVWRADIVRSEGEDFREFFTSIQDHFPVRRADGSSYRPEQDPTALGGDFGLMGFNYRTEPLWHRTGAGMENLFNSRVHGDPATNVWEAYPGDPVVVRLHQVAYEEMHSFVLDGHRWQFGQRDPFSPLTDSFSVGITEAFNAFLECGAGGCSRSPGDYLYRGGAMDDLWPGAWGLFRVHGERKENLLPLPDRAPTFEPEPVCPPGASHRFFDVHAIQEETLYNAYGDHDPHGLAYVRARDVDAVRAGVKRMEPLVLRVASGDCVHVNLTNDIPPGRIPHAHTDPQPTAGYVQPLLHPNVTTGELLATRPYQPGDRVGFFVHMFGSDVQESYGSRVGFNRDSTVGPGETRQFTFWTDALPNVVGLVEDLGDIVTNRHHGLWGAIVVQHARSVITDPVTGFPNDGAAIADVHREDGTASREAVLMQQSGVALWTLEGRPFPVRPVPPEDDAEDDADDAAAVGDATRARDATVRFLRGFTEWDVTAKHVRNGPPGFLVDGVIVERNATKHAVVRGDHAEHAFQADVGLDGRVRQVRVHPDAALPLLGEKAVRLTTPTGRPIVGVDVVLDHRDGEETRTTDAHGIARFESRLVPETISTIRVPGTALRVPVRAGFDAEFQLHVRAHPDHFKDATRAAEIALAYLKARSFPPAPAGVGGVDVTGDVWRVRAEDALRVYELKIDPFTGEIVDFAFEARATPMGPPAFVPRDDIVQAARLFLDAHYGPADRVLVQARLDRFHSWRVDFEEPAGKGTESIGTSLRVDGQTARVLALARAPTDAFEPFAPLPVGPVHLRVRAEDGTVTEGELVLVFRHGVLTGQLQLQAGGRTTLTPRDTGHAHRPGQADVKIPHLGLGFPVDARGREVVVVDVAGARATTNVKAMIAIREAALLFERFAPEDALGGPAWGLTGLQLSGDGTWHVALANARYRLDVRVDSATGRVVDAVVREWVTPRDDCSGQPLEHYGPHKSCPSSFSAVDEEDQGVRAFNYRSEPYENRFLRVPDPALVHSTLAHREPATPLIRAHPKDPLTIHLVGVMEKGRMGTFSVTGHAWSQNPVFVNTLNPRGAPVPPLDSPEGVPVPSQETGTPMTPGTLRQAEGGIGFYRYFRLTPVGGAGGPPGLVGDYLYQGAPERYATPMGEWGILRVLPLDAGGLRKLTDPPRVRPVAPDEGTRACEADADVRLRLRVITREDGTLGVETPSADAVYATAGEHTSVRLRLVDSDDAAVHPARFVALADVPWLTVKLVASDELCLLLDPPRDARGDKAPVRVEILLDGALVVTELDVRVDEPAGPGAWLDVPATGAWAALVAVGVAWRVTRRR